MKQIKFELTSTIFIFLLLFPHFKPRYFDEVAVLDLSFNFLRVLSAGAILVLYFTRRKINLPVLVLLIWKGWLLLTTLFNLDRGADIYTFLIRTVPDVAVFLLCSYMVVNLPNLIRALMMLGEMLIYSNLVTILLFPDGLYHTDRFFQNWLLGYRNQFFSSGGFFVLPLCWRMGASCNVACSNLCQSAVGRFSYINFCHLRVFVSFIGNNAVWCENVQFSCIDLL